MSLQNHLQVRTNLADLNQVLKWFEQFNQPSMPKKTWIQCKTALAEGFANAVKHAHKNLSSQTPIEIAVEVTPERLEIRIWDFGEVFDLKQKLASQTQLPDSTAFSGRGLNLIHQLVDHFSYTRVSGDRNCLLLIKHYCAPK